MSPVPKGGPAGGALMRHRPTEAELRGQCRSESTLTSASQGGEKKGPDSAAWRARRTRWSVAAVSVLVATATTAYFAYDQHRVAQLARTVRQLFAAREYERVR